MELDRIRRKVEAGERLTDAELERLRTAAQRQPGPTLKLAVAHALVNAGQEQSALALMARLVRDFPHDLQCRLGYARTLMTLERKPEAERALQQAVALSPDDPEALKVLAVLAMERGEFARARALVGDVLRRDPFDAEAQLLQSELEAPGDGEQRPAGVQVALRPEFTRALLRVLRSRGVQAQRQGQTLLLRRPSGDVARADLTSLYSAYLAEQRPLEEAARRIADGLVAATLGVPDQKEALLRHVLPVLRPPGFEEVARGAAKKEGPAGLRIFYAIDDPELVRYVPKGSLDARGIGIDELDLAAFALLSTRVAPVRRVGVIGGAISLPTSAARAFAVCAEDGHDGARLLTHAQREVLAREVGPGPWRVNLGLREAALVCRAEDEEACEVVDALSPAPDGIPGPFVLGVEGVLDIAR